MEKIKRIKYFLFGLLMLAAIIIIFSMLYECVNQEVKIKESQGMVNNII